MKKNILALLTIILLVLAVSGCGSNNNNATPNSTGTNSNSKATSEKLEKNITSSAELTARKRLVVFAKNNNSTKADLKIEVEFYDENGNILGSDKDELYGVGAKAEVALEMYNTPDGFDNYKIFVDAEESSNYSYYDKIELTHNNNGNNVVAQAKNNSEDTIEYITAAVVYYKDGKVVGYDYDMQSDIKPGRSANFNFSNPYDNNYNDINFDDYKVFINEAYSFNW